MIKLAFLASGNGTSARAILAAIDAGALAAEAVVLVTNRAASPALAFALERGLATRVIATISDPAAADERLATALVDARADLVILSGYLRKLGPKTLNVFKNRILNIHPSLLPRHGGEGMYGRRVHEAVLAAGDAFSGASVHLVDAEYDHGRILAQARVALSPGETAESLERKVTALEPALFVETLQRLAAGTLRLEG